MIKDGIEYKKCDECGKLCAKLEMVNWKTCKECVISEKDKEIEELKEKLKTAYRKGMRHMAKALKDYDRTDGAWTDYFEHTVDKVLQREQLDFEEYGTLADQLTKARELMLRLYNAGRDVLMCRAEEKAYDNLSNAINDKSIEQFLSEVEK